MIIKNCLLKDEVILKSQQRFISKKHDVSSYTSYPCGYKGKHAVI